MQTQQHERLSTETAAEILSRKAAEEKEEREEFAARMKATEQYFAAKNREEAAALKSEQEANLAASRDRRKATEKAEAQRAWVASGGYPDTFETAWPQIREQMTISQTVAKLGEKVVRRPLLTL